MKHVRAFLIIIGLLLTATCLAQEQNQGFTAGYAYNQGSDQSMQAWGTFDKRISGPLWSYNGTDIQPYLDKATGKNVLRFKLQAFTGLAYMLHDFGRFSLWTSAAGGVASTGDTTTGLAKYSGFAHIPIRGAWGLIVGGEGSYSPLSGSDGIFRVGLRIGMK